VLYRTWAKIFAKVQTLALASSLFNTFMD